MRKFSSIFLLSCFCLYFFGYIVYFFAYQYRLTREWEENIWEESYDNSLTEMMEIPLSLPYMANQDDFQTTNLSMEVDGQFLRVVKQRYQNDTLQVVYIKDQQKQKLNEQVSDWIRSITDNAHNNNQNHKLLFAKFFPKDFIANEISNFEIWSSKLDSTNINTSQTDYRDIFLSLKTPPPQFG